MKSFRMLAEEKILLFDGAMGTVIQNRDVPESAWGDTPGNNEILNITAPRIITDIHRQYYEAGADVAVTNTFGANAIVLGEYGMADRAAEINIAAVRCAKQAAAGLQNRYVALSVGPGSSLPTLGQISYETLYSAYYEQIHAGAGEGADLVIIETSQDLLQIKAAIAAAMRVGDDLCRDLPIMVSFTVEENGALLVGSDIACICTVLGGYDLFSLGINCGFGPDGMRAPFAELAERWKGRLYLSPNAGIPLLIEGKTVYPLKPETFAAQVAELATKYKLSAVGGCCGTTAAHIKALNGKLDRAIKRPIPCGSGAGMVAGTYSALLLTQTPAPTIVGERANATGSKAFRDALKAGEIGTMVSVAKKQEGSAHIIDLSVAVSGGNEMDDIKKIVPLLNTELTAPLMIDSTSPQVIEAALRRISGKPVINSVNLEDGGVKMRGILALLKQHPAAVVALTIDEEGMAQTAEKKLAAARRLCKIWIEEHKLPPEDLLIDFLTFAVTSGDENSRYAAIHTLKAIREFKKEYPSVGTILGVSNISFGMAPASRAVLNAIFLHKAVQAGLSAAIVHAEKVLPVNSIAPEDRTAAEALLDGKDGALDGFIAHFASADITISEKTEETLPPEEKLYNGVLRGDGSGITALMEQLLAKYDASHILNNILLPAMGKVGELFGEGKLLLPFVLKSAEVMRECGGILAPFLKGKDSAARGKIVLATVKGDVHDIGKNLVDIILSGNGYEVINMGTKIPGADIVQVARESKADAIGMSGLLVKSVAVMKENIELIKESGLDVKILLGGAALSEEYVDRECAPIMPGRVYYCKDAFDGMSALAGLKDHSKTTATQTAKNEQPFKNKKWSIRPFEGTITPAFYGNSGVETVTLADILPYLRKKSLFEGRWGYRKEDGSNEKAEKMLEEMLSHLEQASPVITPAFIYGFYKARVKGSELWVAASANPEEREWKLFASFPSGAGGECLTDLYRTASGSSVLPLQVVTLGDAASLYASSLFTGDRYSQYYQYHGLFAELTEALAGYGQKRTQAFLTLEQSGMPHTPEKIIRYSFGYPLCPDLSGNKTICELMEASKLGVKINETYQIEPVYTTCAMLSWHPAAGH